MSTTARNALGAQSFGNALDNEIWLGDSASHTWKIKANGTSGRLEFIKDGVVVSAGNAKSVSVKAASYTLLASDGGKFFTTTGASGTVTFTLPAIADVYDGWTATFMNVVGQTMAVAAPSGKLVAFNNASATSITYSTSSELIGSGVTIVYDATLAKYIAMPVLGSETATPTIA